MFIKKVKLLFNVFKKYPAIMLIDGKRHSPKTPRLGKEEGVEESFGAGDWDVLYFFN